MRISDWSSDVCSSDLRFIGRAEFGTRRFFDAARVPRRLDARHLHAQADAEEGDVPFAREADAGDLAFGPALAEADRKSVVSGKSVSERVDLGGRRIIKKKTQIHRKHYKKRYD